VARFFARRPWNDAARCATPLFCAAPLVAQQRNRRIIRSDVGQKQIADTQSTNAKSVPNLKADLDRWPTRLECCEK
jgi:hypothetical protein